MKYSLFYFTFFTLLVVGCSRETKSGGEKAPPLQKEENDSIAFRKANIEKWHAELQADYDSVVSFAFYIQKDYLELKQRLDKYESVPKEEKLVDDLNDNMFSGGDPDHRFSRFVNLGEVGHFFEQTKKELDEAGVNYSWDTKKTRYVLRK
ncbi:MAG: hypothetical protein ACOZCO_08325 [Bacteroidota bacterium]